MFVVGTTSGGFPFGWIEPYDDEERLMDGEAF